VKVAGVTSDRSTSGGAGGVVDAWITPQTLPHPACDVAYDQMLGSDIPTDGLDMTRAATCMHALVKGRDA
jgi:hypothetical protein